MTLSVDQRLRLFGDEVRQIESELHECEHLKTQLEGKLMHLNSGVVSLRKRLDEITGQHSKEGKTDVSTQEQRPGGSPAAGECGPKETQPGGTEAG